MKRFNNRNDIDINRLSNYELKSIYNLYVNYKDKPITKVCFNDMSGFKDCFGLSREEEFKEFIRSDKYKSEDMYISIDIKGNPITFDNVLSYIKKQKMISTLELFIDDELDLVVTILNEDW